MSAHPRTAVILSGGFAFGAYQVGVLLALSGGRCAHTGRRPLPIDVVTGTSIGAVNASLLLSADTADPLAAAESLHEVYMADLASSPRGCRRGAIRLRGNPLPLFQPECYRAGPLTPLLELAGDAAVIGREALVRAAEFLRSSAPVEDRLFRLVDLSIFASTTRFGELLRRRIDPHRIRSARTRLQVLAANWRTGDLRVFDPRELDDGSLLHAIEASAAVPGIMPPVGIDGELYADGGLVMNTGLRPAIEAGAEELHVVYMDTAVGNMRLSPLQGTADTIYRMLAINLASMLNRDIEIARKINSALGSGAPARADGATMGALLTRSQTERPYRRLRIHRYRAATELGGAQGWVSFDYRNLARLIERGFRDTIAHDCAASGCLSEGDSVVRPWPKAFPS